MRPIRESAHRFVSLQSFGPFQYHPVGGEKLSACVLLDAANGMYSIDGRILVPIVQRDENGFIVINHWKRDPKSGRKFRQPHWPPTVKALESDIDEVYGLW